MTIVDPEQLTIGAFIDALKGLDPQRMITFEFGGCFATEFDSYRGYTGELSLGFSDRRGAGCLLVGELLKKATLALEIEFSGWDNEERPISRSTPLWVANEGCVTETAIVGIVERGSVVYITTAWKE